MLESEQWLVDCLRHSLVKTVCLAPELGETGILFWANACQQSGKKVVLRISSGLKLRKCDSFSWALKRAVDRLVAVLLLLVLSPVLLVLACSIRLTSPGPLFFRQWRVGKGGQLFQILKFRSMAVDAEKKHYQVMGERAGLHKCQDDPRVTRLGRWMRRYSLDELPQLINVLRGEMSLVGPRPWALYDALRLGSSVKKRLKALPGITGAWQVMARSNLLDLEAVSQYDLEYLKDWSLWKDLGILLLTIPKVLSGSGAY
jgi:lipopolysaccharide/colanic/teichoic acid biosynthesis glycosyltransferase